MESIKTLFTNHTNHIHGDFVKLEFHIFVFVSGAYLLLRKPAFLIMLIPIYAQKLFHDNIAMWSFEGQYAIEFAPILAIGIFDSITTITSKRNRTILLWFVLIGSIFVSIRMMDSTIHYTQKSRIRFYQSSHFKRDYNVTAIHEQLAKIPHDATVSAQTTFVPHLVLRNSIYQFPMIKDADFIVYSEFESTYPINKETFYTLTLSLERSPEWKISYKNHGFTILKKIKVEP